MPRAPPIPSFLIWSVEKYLLKSTDHAIFIGHCCANFVRTNVRLVGMKVYSSCGYGFSFRVDRQCTYNVYRNITAHLCNHCFSGKAMNITHYECAVVTLHIQHATRMRYIVICRLSGSAVIFHIISPMVQLSGKKTLLNIICVFRFSVQICPKHFSF